MCSFPQIFIDMPPLSKTEQHIWPFPLHLSSNSTLPDQVSFSGFRHQCMSSFLKKKKKIIEIVWWLDTPYYAVQCPWSIMWVLNFKIFFWNGKIELITLFKKLKYGLIIKQFFSACSKIQLFFLPPFPCLARWRDAWKDDGWWIDR